MDERPADAGRLIAARDIAAQRGGRLVLSGVTLAIGPGDLFILRGPNGAGKTTLLRTLAGLSQRAAGALKRSDNASVFLGHADGVKAALTARESLSFWRMIYSAPPAIIERAISRLNIFPFLDQRGASLSAGQRRRLALCRIVISRRPVWLLDEPTSGMDAVSIRAVVDLIAEHCRDDGAAVVATHEPLDFGPGRTIMLDEAA